MSYTPGTGPLFEDNLSQINHLITIKLSKWKLCAGIPAVGLDDLRQILLIHVHEKWDQYNPKRPLGNWLNTVLKNRIFNLQRDLYHKYVSVCNSCPANIGGQCKIFGNIESVKCALFNDWVKNKKASYNVNLPVTLENHTLEVGAIPFNEINFDQKIEDLKVKLQDVLSPCDYTFFLELTLQHRPEKEVLAEMDFPTKTLGLQALKIYKLHILDTVKKILREEELF